MIIGREEKEFGESVKKRNSTFAKWSRYLRKSVELYGSVGWNHDEKKDRNQTSHIIKYFIIQS